MSAPIEVALSSDQVRVLQPEELLLDTLGLVPHRSEFADVFYDKGVGELRAWRYFRTMPFSFTVSPRRRPESLLEIRRQLLEDGPQVVWWDANRTDTDAEPQVR